MMTECSELFNVYIANQAQLHYPKYRFTRSRFEKEPPTHCVITERKCASCKRRKILGEWARIFSSNSPRIRSLRRAVLKKIEE